MKKLLIALTILFISTKLFAADVEVTLTFPSEYVPRIVAAITTQADKNLNLDVYYKSKQGDETNLEFYKRAVKELIRGLVLDCEETTAKEEYRQCLIDAAAAVPIPDVSVPEDLVE